MRIHSALAFTPRRCWPYCLVSVTNLAKAGLDSGGADVDARSWTSLSTIPRTVLLPGAGHEALVFIGSHVDGLVDQQHRDAVLDAVGLVQARVVEHSVDQQQRTPVSRAHQDAQELVVEHGATTA